MKSVDQITAFYVEALVEGKGDFSARAKSLGQEFYHSIQKGLLYWLAAIIASALLLNSSNTILVTILLSAIVIGWYLRKDYLQLKQAFNTECYSAILPKVVQFADDSLQYEANQGITRHVFQDSKLVPGAFVRYQGQDYITGQWEGVHFEMSDVYAAVERKGIFHFLQTAFHGVCVIIDNDKSFPGHLVIRPKPNFMDEEDRQEYEAFYKPFNNINVGYAAFDRYFEVFSDCTEDVHQLLSSRMIMQMMSLRAKYGDNVYLVFNGNKIVIGINGLHVFDRSKNVYFDSFYSDDVVVWYSELMRACSLIYDVRLAIKS
ncbi:DUF3137 domain-containing protein [Endozoicomonas sp. SM1973]|uniref:DUF3137 domain-containing protein n=1 Tax=Spartinivicinus marinus TaxID=2994442 RepID=A0A853IER6_9GAMM|nr:DUF3137 domain-containing protein [Spartinivicinus marinus]MCX4025245.1 DUF3137 domain-containing protein [Spartinivicinus marinus]NYZ65966.1 DUF3137 domain-containing protein [Spartinivicinus marinus]